MQEIFNHLVAPMFLFLSSACHYFDGITCIPLSPSKHQLLLLLFLLPHDSRILHAACFCILTFLTSVSSDRQKKKDNNSKVLYGFLRGEPLKLNTLSGGGGGSGWEVRGGQAENV